MGKVSCLVILPDQLVGAVVDIRSRIGAVADGGDIAVGIVRIRIGNIVLGILILPRGDLPGGGAVLG